jgi:Tfp pilus assembly protein PilN
VPIQRINLLPPEERRKASRERGLMYALLFLIFVVAVLGVLYVFENQRLSTRHQQVASLQADLDVVSAQVAQLKPYETLQSQRANMTQTASQIVDSRVAWSSIFEEISLLIPDAVRLSGLTAAVPATMLAGGQISTAAGAAAGGADMTFSGTATSHKDVADFMTRLALMPQLMSIKLVSAQKGAAGSTSGGSSSTDSTATVVTFQITAQLRPFETAPPLAAAAAPTAATTQSSGQ